MCSANCRATGGRTMKPAISYEESPDPTHAALDLPHEIERRSFSGSYRPRVKFLPHEYVFGLFLLITWVRLVAQPGQISLASFVFLGCLLTSLAVILWAARRPSP